MNFDVRNETARGYMLLSVFYVHTLYALIATIPDPSNAPLSFIQIKLLAPHISVFFFLSGMTSRGIGKRNFNSILQQSLMLLFMAWISQLVGMLISVALYGGYPSVDAFIKATLKPIVYGTGDCTYVAWFFTVLAVTRILVWIFERNNFAFVFVWALIVMLIYVAWRLYLPDNLWEWRNWPAATLFLLIGMRIPRDWQVPHYLGVTAFVGTMILTWFNQPGVLHAVPCVTCNIEFVAQPMVGEYGSLPVFIVQEILFLLFLLWFSQFRWPAILGRVVRYFGRPSAQFLLLHGWVITAVYPFMTSHFPPKENLLLILAFFLLNPCFHAALFKVLENPLNKVLMFCFASGRWVTAQSFKLLDLRERRPAGR